MDNLQESTNVRASTLQDDNDIKIEDTLSVYHPNGSGVHNIQTSLKEINDISQVKNSNYSTLSFTTMDIKEEENPEENDGDLSHSSGRFQSVSVPVIATASQMKVDSSPILNRELTVVPQGVQFASAGTLLSSESGSTHKTPTSQQSIIHLGQNVHFSSSLNVSNPINQGVSSIPCRSSDIGQSVQMFPTPLNNSEAILNQQQHSGQTFILTSPGTVLSSNHVVSQGQVFLQGDDLVGVSLPTTAPTSGYTVSSTESPYVSTLPMVLGGNQAIGNSVPRLIIQQQQSAGQNLGNQILSSNNGHYLIQVGQSLPTVSQNNFSVNNKGHIVIRAGSTKVKEESETSGFSSDTKDGIFRVVIPEGTTKLPKLSQPLQVLGNTDDSIRKHVQINLSNRATVSSPSKVSHNDTSVQTQKETKTNEKVHTNSGRKLYECSNCNSKFMKPLYLRMHMRSCKPPEMKMEKSPLFMCSFCKATFKTKPQICHHFTKCPQNPYKDAQSGKRKADEVDETPSKKKPKSVNVDLSLEMAVQFKCQDCDRTFSKERQYTSHIKRCTKVSVHDLSGARLEPSSINAPEEERDSIEDPFADPPLPQLPTKRGRGGGGRRGRPPGRVANSQQKVAVKNDVLFTGEKVEGSFSSLVVADNENLVRSTTGLAHTVLLSLESSQEDRHKSTTALLADSKGVHGRESLPYSWSLVCSLCQKMFLTKPALASHMVENHGPDLRATRNILNGENSEEKLFKCPMCFRFYQSSTAFIEHLVIQHTSKLQEHYKSLQLQTATFVCSLCSLVLLTKNLLMEHLSLEHLDQLEKTYSSAKQLRLKKAKEQLINFTSSNREKASDAEEEAEIMENDKFQLETKSEDGGNAECGICGEEFHSALLMINHYAQSHGVQTDANGAVVDVGLDVDIRVKDTRHLLQMAEARGIDELSDAMPRKTVLIRRKPKQSWQCQHCQQVFSKQMTWLRHIRELCPVSNHSSGDSGRVTASRESRFFCHEPECGHLAFYQVKSLFKHLEEVHKMVISKERKTFKNLSAFQQWLMEEEDTHRVRFVRDNTRIEKGNVRLIQMVCHRFHSTKIEQAKEKEDRDQTKPTKKRWFARIQRANNCHARIHLRVELNATSSDYDGETQMIYYPQHFHNGEEDSLEVLDKVREKYSRDKWLGGAVSCEVPQRSNASSQVISGDNSNCYSDCDNTSSFTLDSTNKILQLPADDVSVEEPGIPGTQQPAKSFQLQEHTLVDSPLKSNSSATQAVLLPPTTTHPSLVFKDEPSQSTLTETGTLLAERPPSPTLPTDRETSSFLADEMSEFSEDCVLPADDAEWTKLFELLATRLASGQFTEVEQKESQTLLSYRKLIPIINIAQQVSIFQRMCAITNTSLD